jgi:GNAT superfamily N-acetyltransferase
MTAVAVVEMPAHPLANIRSLSADQASAVGTLLFDAYLGTVDDHGEAESWHRAEAERTFAGEFGEVVWQASKAAVVDDRLVGATVVTFEYGRILLAFALVQPQLQSQGLGTSLIAASARALLDLGHSEWTLAVSRGNPARHLYERLGFSDAPELLQEPPWSTTE